AHLRQCRSSGWNSEYHAELAGNANSSSSGRSFTHGTRSPRSPGQAFQGACLVHRHMLGLIALDFKLRILSSGTSCVTLVLYVAFMHLDDATGYMPCFGIPSHVIPNLERPGHDQSPHGGPAPFATR